MVAPPVLHRPLLNKPQATEHYKLFRSVGVYSVMRVVKRENNHDIKYNNQCFKRFKEYGRMTYYFELHNLFQCQPVLGML